MHHRLGTHREWLEPDGLGGFASGTLGLVRTRRYHGLLLAATTPPTGRMLLVSGCEAHVVTEAGRFALSAQHYTPDVIYPNGVDHLQHFESTPWPRWRFALPDGTCIEHELFACHGSPRVVLRWRLLTPGAQARLELRPLLSGRDYHALQRENGAFRFAAEVSGERLRFQPYAGVPAVLALSNGQFEQAPDWYRNFLYTHERERGLDCVEDLACPGVIHYALDAECAVLVLQMDAAAWPMPRTICRAARLRSRPFALPWPWPGCTDAITSMTTRTGASAAGNRSSSRRTCSCSAETSAHRLRTVWRRTNDPARDDPETRSGAVGRWTR